ncbi:MAG TPA: hypothetical protein PKC43_00435 [Phycisphaerales bacterium]|nr:hypothetical protein [Phycisphaerales bacterium]HMP35892.1 hypothetical protein [Phycisphaerales bacterium]
MRGRRGRSGDSLELLLDVVCNLFGSIIFIALLTALLVRAGGRAEPSTGEAPATAAEVKALRAEIAALRRRIEEPGLRDRLASAGLVSEAARRDEEARAELDRRRVIAAEYERRIGELEEDADLGAERRAGLELELAALVAERDALRSLTERTLRTPRRRDVARTFPAQIVLSRGRAYVVNDWRTAGADPCRVYCTWNPDAVDLAAGPTCVVHDCWADGTLFIERSVPLRADGGVVVRGPAALAAEPAWARAIAGLDPSVHVVSFRVAPDSFGIFAAVREDLARRGFAYDVNPTLLPADAALYTDVIVQGTPTAQ